VSVRSGRFEDLGDVIARDETLASTLPLFISSHAVSLSAEPHPDRYGEATLRFPSETELGRDEHLRAECDAGA
jgi:hypothetical protein